MTNVYRWLSWILLTALLSLVFGAGVATQGSGGWTENSGNNVVHLTTTSRKVSMGGTTTAYDLEIIGKGSGNATLRLVPTGAFDAEFYLEGGSSDEDPFLIFRQNGTSLWTIAADIEGNNNGLNFYSYTGTTGTHLFLDPSGKIGAGTTNPIAKLDVRDSLAVGSTNSGTTAGIRMPIDFFYDPAGRDLFVASLIVGEYAEDPADLRIRGEVPYSGGAVTGNNKFGDAVGKIHFDALTGCSGGSCGAAQFREMSLIQGKVAEFWWDGTTLSSTIGTLSANVHPGDLQFLTYPPYTDESQTRMFLTSQANLFIGGGGWGSEGLAAYVKVGGSEDDCWSASNGAYPLHRVVGGVGRCGSTVFVRGGGIRVRNLRTPLAPTLTTVGSGGSTTWRYRVIAVDAAGNTTEPSPEATISGPSTLSTTNYNVLQVEAVQGAEAYVILRGTGNDALYSNVAASTSCKDESTRSVTSLSRTGTTATMTTASGHGFFAGQVFSIAGVTNDSEWNKTWGVVTVPSSTQVTFTVPSTLTTPASGSITATRSQGVCYFHGSGPNGSTDEVYIKADGKLKYFADTGYGTQTQHLPDRDTTADFRIDGAVAIKGVEYAKLGSGEFVRSGMMIYCTNCARTNPCSSGGSGAMAFRIGSSWECAP